MKNYYKVLGISENATFAVIKEQHRKLSKEYSPETNKSKNAAKKLAEIKEAYGVLSVASKRKEYDASRALPKEKVVKEKKVETKKEVLVEEEDDDTLEERAVSKKNSEQPKGNSTFRVVAIILGLVALMGAIFFVSELTNKNTATANPKKELVTIDYAKFVEKVTASSKSIVMVGRPDCSWCVKLKPVLEKIAGQYNIEISYLNVNTFTEEDYNNYLKIDTVSASKGLGTPMIFVVSEGKIQDRIDGYVEKATVEQFLTKNQMI